MNIKRSTKAMAGIAVAVTLLGGGVAYAYWSTGYNVANAQTGGSTESFEVFVSVSGSQLSPGGGPQTVTYTVTNKTGATKALSSVYVSIANADGTVWAPSGCSANDFRFGPADNPQTWLSVIPGVAPLDNGQSHIGTVEFRMIDTGYNQDGCKNLSIPIRVEAN